MRVTTHWWRLGAIYIHTQFATVCGREWTKSGATGESEGQIVNNSRLCGGLAAFDKNRADSQVSSLRAKLSRFNSGANGNLTRPIDPLIIEMQTDDLLLGGPLYNLWVGKHVYFAAKSTDGWTRASPRLEKKNWNPIKSGGPLEYTYISARCSLIYVEINNICALLLCMCG
jgi:hypothetical protein